MFLKNLLIFFGAVTAPILPASDQKIAFQNSILFQVREKTFSMMDVKKKMDLLFYQNYPDLAPSIEARFQFYNASWQNVLSEMVDQELILLDAEQREIKVTDGEVREAIEERFGPSVTETLDKMGVRYSDAWQLVKNDLIVQRMMWWFAHAKALQRITPQKIRQAYRDYLQKNPSYREVKYQVLTIRGETPEKSAKKISEFLAKNKEAPSKLINALKEIEPNISLSSEYTRRDTDLSQVYKSILSELLPGEYSKPTFQMKSGKEALGKLFYLVESTDFPAPSFEEISPKLKGELTNRYAGEEGKSYLEKLHKQYGFDKEQMKGLISQNTPFSLTVGP